MKKRKIITIIAVSVAGELFGILFVLFTLCLFTYISNYTTCYSNIDYYTEDTYASLDIVYDYTGVDGTLHYSHVADNCKQYLPEYDTFEYKQYAKKFYIFEDMDATSLVLELQFDTVSEYENFLAYEHNRCEYTDEFDVEYHGYKCYVTTDSEYTLVRKGTKVPALFGMLCENQEDLTVRYLYYYSRGDLRVWFFRVFRQTNCDW